MPALLLVDLAISLIRTGFVQFSPSLDRATRMFSKLKVCHVHDMVLVDRVVAYGMGRALIVTLLQISNLFRFNAILLQNSFQDVRKYDRLISCFPLIRLNGH